MRSNKQSITKNLIALFLSFSLIFSQSPSYAIPSGPTPPPQKVLTFPEEFGAVEERL